MHKILGPGFLESVYEKCFLRELSLRGISFKGQLWVTLNYKGLELDTELRLDILVEDIHCIDLKHKKAYCQYMMQSCFRTCKC